MSTPFDNSTTIAYFSMEIGIDSFMPTYSGGLGVLAGDTLRAAADLSLPMVAITLLHRKGYFRQHLDIHGNQSESPADWSPEEFLEELPVRAAVIIEGREVHIRAWRYSVSGVSGHIVPVYFLDTALSENSLQDQAITDQLYGGDLRYRLFQEVVLGMGGIAILRGLGYNNHNVCHMNEGHSALLTLALLEERIAETGFKDTVRGEDIEYVRQSCVFTTHTPVPAGHDKFSLDLVRQVLGNDRSDRLAEYCIDHTLNLTHLALYFSRYINGVSMRHEDISRGMFPDYPINSITNGVHAGTWTAEPFQLVYDYHIPEWRHDNLYLRYAFSIPLDDIQQAHYKAKQALLTEVERRTGVKMNPSVMTIGFARRATAYKRADLLFSDHDRLRRIVNQTGPLQIIYGGKAHPNDEGGKELIRKIFEAANALRDSISVVYLEEYDISLAKYLCSGVDLWLNTPQKPHEASGTSGMKAALNGIPSFSVLDGWWIEGCVEGVTGWAIDDSWQSESERRRELVSLYDKLEYNILPMFYTRPKKYAEIMRSAITLNGSFFNANRMMGQYIRNSYFAAE